MVITTPNTKYAEIPRYVVATAAERIIAIPAYVAGALIFSARNSRPTIAIIGHTKQSRIAIIPGLWTPDEFCDDKGILSIVLEILSKI